MLDEVIAALAPKAGDIVIDGTLGGGGHAVEFLRLISPGGKLIGLDLDPGTLDAARKRLLMVGEEFSLHIGNYAGVEKVLGMLGVQGCDRLFLDLGMSSIQLDDPERGLSYMRDGPLDMRLAKERGPTAGQLLQMLSEEEIAGALREFGDEPAAELIARAIVKRRETRPLERTSELARLVLDVYRVPHDKSPARWNSAPLSRVFQALRILVNREIANLEHLLRVLPRILKPGGRAAILSFHGGEDRLVKHSFREGLRTGAYSAISESPLRPTKEESLSNPRSRSAKLRWAERQWTST